MWRKENTIDLVIKSQVKIEGIYWVKVTSINSINVVNEASVMYLTKRH